MLRWICPTLWFLGFFLLWTHLPVVLASLFWRMVL